MNKLTVTVVLFLTVILAVILFGITSFGKEDSRPSDVIGVIMPGSVDEIGWNGVHYKGIKEAADDLGVDVKLIENVKEFSGECAKAIESMVASGIKLVILGSYNYPEEVSAVIKAHPEVMFFCCSSEYLLSNYKPYFARAYQARYLSGLVAGMQSEKGKIGYIAAMNNSEVNRGINAFALGVRRVNPNASVTVIWTNSWDDAELEKKNVKTLVEKVGVDLVTYHQNQTNVIEAAEAEGIYSIGYNINQGSFSPKLLSSVSTNWKMVYREFIQDFLQKKHSTSNYWLGIDKDAVALKFFSSMVSDSVKNVVAEEIEKMKNGADIFSGVIYDNAGKRRCDKDELVSDDDLRSRMDWFVEGVVLYEE